MEELLKRREELKKKLRELLDNLAETGTKKILNAIKNQRWFFFANKPKVLMDRDTAILWADLNHFPYGKNNNQDRYSRDNSYSEIRDLIARTNSESFGGFNDWKIPTPFELWKMIEDTSFPFTEGGNWRIEGWCYWCVNNDGLISTDLDGSNPWTPVTSSRYNVCVLPCSHAYVPDDHEKNISSSTLNIFVQNELIPMFNDEAITQLYRKIFVDKPALLKQLAEIDAQIAESEQSQIRFTADFDYRPILAKYDVAAINKSAIKYFDAVLSVTDELLNVLQEYEASQSETIAKFLKITLNLGAKYTDNPNLTEEENSLLSERQRVLARRLEIGIDEPTRRILSVKAQAERFFERLDAINGGAESISELAELQAAPRADFELLLENMARIIRDVQQRVDFFAEHKDFVSIVVEAQTAWSDNYKAFKTSLHEELTADCRNDKIDDEIFAAWYDDWQTKRFAIEQRFMPLVEFAIKGNLLDATDSVMKTLQGYRDAVDKFYLHERKNIYQKFAFVPGGDLQEKFEIESELYKRTEVFQRDLQKIIFACDKTEERIFLLKWAEPLLNLSVDAITDFICERELDSISEKILNQFAALRRQNLMSYLADSAAFSKALQQREKDYNQLMFCMRKDLNKQ